VTPVVKTGGTVEFQTQLTMISFMTDSDFNTITSADAVFTPDKATNSQKLTATNPGTYMLNRIFQNPGPTDATVQAVIKIPSASTPTGTLAQAFCLKGATPSHVYAGTASHEVSKAEAGRNQQEYWGQTGMAFPGSPLLCAERVVVVGESGSDSNGTS